MRIFLAFIFSLVSLSGLSAPADSVLCEAEEFQTDGKGWKRGDYGENYYVGTFANTFLSRKAFLGAPEQCRRSVATFKATIPAAGKYLVLVRYEAAYRFQTQFRVVVEQNETQFDRLYGAHENIKVWPFGKRLTNEVAWDWGASENIVWEGHDASVELKQGPALIRLVAEQQPTPAAKRNVDLVLLTQDIPGIQNRIAKEGYLPLDGLLTQSGDVYLRARNGNKTPLTLTAPTGTEHSPYWVHQRTWKPKTLSAAPGETTEWMEVGSLLDSLNDGQWQLSAKKADGLSYSLEFAVPGPSGKFETIRRFENLTNDISLAYDANTKHSKRIRTSAEILYELVDYLKKHPVRGTAPRQTLIYGTTFAERPRDLKYAKALEEFIELMGATALSTGSRDDSPIHGLRRGYIDVRDQSSKQLETTCQKLIADGKADRIAIVSLGDEIGLPSPPRNASEDFRKWLQSQPVQPAEIVPGANDWSNLEFGGRDVSKNPRLFYWTELYRQHYGIQAQKQLTDALRRSLPHALIGANYSPHHAHFYLGETHKWVSLFREGGMTMPWSEDYIFQVPVGSQQMNFLGLDLFRAGIKNKADAKIHYYVMAHWPGNTANSWRRQFYGDLAHGAKIINLFEFRPVQAAYTENHCSSLEMYQSVREAFYELGTFEDILQRGQIRAGVAGLWFSQTGDIWKDNDSPFDAAKRSLYLAIRHQELPLDVVVDGDDLSAYKILYLADKHVARTASKAIADWVRAGGRLFATAGAGMFDEFNEPNMVLRDLLGVEQLEWIKGKEPIRLEKQDLPFASALTRASWNGAKLDVFGAWTRIKVQSAKIEGAFEDGSPAVTSKQTGNGRAVYCAFLPGLSWLKPALPMRPVDRSSRDDSLCHFIPTDFDKTAAQLIGSVADVDRPVTCADGRIETTIIDSKDGSVIPMINWSPAPIRNLQLTLNEPVSFQKAALASGRPVRVSRRNGKTTFDLKLDVADALILRR
jgi:hypothetical protein